MARTARRPSRVHYVTAQKPLPRTPLVLGSGAPSNSAPAGGLGDGVAQSSSALTVGASDGFGTQAGAPEALPPSPVPLTGSTVQQGGAPGTRAVADVGMRLAEQFSAPYLKVGEQRIVSAFQEDPVLTGILLGSAALVGIGAYVGWQASREGRVQASPSISLGTVRLGLTGGYDFGTNSWRGLVRFDLSRLVDIPTKDPFATAPVMLTAESEPPQTPSDVRQAPARSSSHALRRGR